MAAGGKAESNTQELSLFEFLRKNQLSGIFEITTISQVQGTLTVDRRHPKAEWPRVHLRFI